MHAEALPGAEALLGERLLARLAAAGREGLSHDELARDPVPRGAGEALLDRALTALATTARAVEIDGRWLAVEASPWIAGAIDRLESGDGLLRPGAGREPGFFVPRRYLKGALDGDTVLARPLGRGRRPVQHGERLPRLPDAAVERIVARRRPTLVGAVDRDEQGRRWLVPFDTKVNLDLEVTGAGDLPPGHFAVVAVERPGPGRPAQGRLVEALGDPSVPGVDVEIVLRHHRIPEEFPAEVRAASEGLPENPRPADWAGREDLRGAVVVTIDGETARDFDDAISIERLPYGDFRLGIHIADVAQYVPEGSALDVEAYRRGTSVYYPERAIPMIPERLSNGLCSLRPRVPRLTLSVFLDLARDGQVLARRFAETVIESARRLTYSEVRRLLEEPRPADAAEYGAVLPALRELRYLMEVLHRARRVRGSIDFDLPEGDVALDSDGVMIGILPEERNVAHRIVEESMIAANEAVAFELARQELPALYRVHDAPSQDRLEELDELLRPVGLRLYGHLDELPPGALQEVMSRIAGRPEEHFVSTLVLRTQKRASYSPECRGHYALASPTYTHFTSPIRRYPDLIVHRQLKSLLRLGAEAARAAAAASELAERLPAIAEHSSATERRAESSERDLVQWKKVRFMAGRVGERFKGRITGVQPFGLFVQLEGAYVDGLVPIRTLGDDFYVFEPEAHRLVGERGGRVFQLADEVEVNLVGVDLRHRGLDFTLADLPAAGKMERRPGPAGRTAARGRGGPARPRAGRARR
ncbi:MAG TPA: ribonuclease R [Thermoanaerobaculia bacterium]